jgi:tetratricopeptide (TPR) repeat protein
LADDLRRFVRGEPILARPIGPLPRLWRLARRKPLVAALTVTLAVVFLGGLAGVLGTWRLAEQRRQVAEEHARLAQQQRDEAAQARQQAEDNFRLARQVVDNYCRRLSDGLRDAPELQPLRKDLLRDALNYYHAFLERRGHDPALRRELADTYQNVARATNAIGARADARDAYKQAVAIYRDLQRADPDNVELQRRLGGLLNDAATYQDRTEDVVGRLKEAHGLYKRFLEKRPGDWDLRAGQGLTRSNLAWACQQLGRLKESRHWYREARQLQEQLLREKPGNRPLQSNLAATLTNYASLRDREFGGNAEAVALLERACQLREALARTAPADANAQADLASVLQNLCTSLRSAGRPADAYKACQRAFAIRQDLCKRFPRILRYQSDLAASHRWLGFFDRADKRFEQALDHHQKARDIQTQLVRLDPSSPQRRRELSWSYFNVGAIHGALDRRPEEQQTYQKARELQEGLVRVDPNNLDYREDLVRTLNNLGWNRMAMKRPDEASVLLRQALDHARLAVRRASGIRSYRETLTHALATLTEAELRQGHTRTAADLVRERGQLWPGDAEEQFRVAHDLAATAAKAGNKAEREAELQDALNALRQAAARGFRDGKRSRIEVDKRTVRRRGSQSDLALSQLGL